MSLMDPKFKYVHSSKTDVSKTFARIRKQLKEQAEREAEAKKTTATVRALRKAT